MPAAPVTLKSLATCVSLEMLISLRAPIFKDSFFFGLSDLGFSEALDAVLEAPFELDASDFGSSLTCSGLGGSVSDFDVRYWLVGINVKNFLNLVDRILSLTA